MPLITCTAKRPQHILIPNLSCPFSWNVHPLHESICDRYDEWILNVMSPQSEEERLHLLGQRLTLLACMLYPGACHNRIHSIVKLILWFTMLDDAVDDVEDLGASFDKTKVLVKQYLNITQGGYLGDLRTMSALPSTHVRLLQIFASLWNGFQHDMSPSQFSTLKHHIQSMLTLQAHLTKSRQENAIPGERYVAVSPEEFTARKRVSGMHLFGLHLLEYALGVELSQDMQKDPELLELYRLTADCMLFCNELLSFRMEFLANDFDNILWIICEAENKSLDESALRVKDMWDENVMKLNELHHVLAERYSDVPGIEKLLQGTRDILAGYSEWCWRTGRYHGYAWTPPCEREGIMFLDNTKSSAKFLELKV